MLQVRMTIECETQLTKVPALDHAKLTLLGVAAHELVE
jgi:hypothetical protein